MGRKMASCTGPSINMRLTVQGQDQFGEPLCFYKRCAYSAESTYTLMIYELACKNEGIMTAQHLTTILR